MDRALSELLSVVIVETLEKMAYLLATAIDGPESDVEEEALETIHVRFHGPISGGLQLGLSASLLAELAGNMLGVAEGVAPSLEEQQDALRELANVVCGNLLPVIGGPEAEFAIGSPQRVGRGAPAPRPWSFVSRLAVEGGVCLVALEWDASPAACRAGEQASVGKGAEQ